MHAACTCMCVCGEGADLGFSACYLHHTRNGGLKARKYRAGGTGWAGWAIALPDLAVDAIYNY